jgi:hypothetical protein
MTAAVDALLTSLDLAGARRPTAATQSPQSVLSDTTARLLNAPAPSDTDGTAADLHALKFPGAAIAMTILESA